MKVDSKDMKVFLVAPHAASDKNGECAPGTSTSTEGNNNDDDNETPFDNDWLSSRTRAREQNHARALQRVFSVGRLSHRFPSGRRKLRDLVGEAVGPRSNHGG